MDVKRFSDFGVFAQEVLKNMESVKNNITVVAYYEDAINVLKELIKDDNVIIYSVDIHSCFHESYDREYYITLVKEEDDYLLYCEKAYDVDKGIYLYGESDILYIAEDCNSKILQRCKSYVCHEARFFEDELFDTYADEDDEDEFVEKSSNKEIKVENDMTGFSISESDDYGYSSFSFHSTDENLVKEILKLYKKF